MRNLRDSSSTTGLTLRAWPSRRPATPQAGRELPRTNASGSGNRRCSVAGADGARSRDRKPCQRSSSHPPRIRDRRGACPAPHTTVKFRRRSARSHKAAWNCPSPARRDDTAPLPRLDFLDNCRRLFQDHHRIRPGGGTTESSIASRKCSLNDGSRPESVMVKIFRAHARRERAPADLEDCEDASFSRGNTSETRPMHLLADIAQNTIAWSTKYLPSFSTRSISATNSPGQGFPPGLRPRASCSRAAAHAAVGGGSFPCP